MMRTMLRTGSALPDNPWARAVLAVVATGIACGLLVRWGDRAAVAAAGRMPAAWVQFWGGIAWLGHPVLYIAAAALALLALIVLRRRLSPQWRDRLRLLGWAMPVTWLLSDWLQFLFARVNPDVYLARGDTGFLFLVSGVELTAFPSTPAAMTGAAAALTWRGGAAWRRAGAALVLTVGLARVLAVANYPGDILAGVLVGALTTRAIEGLHYHYAAE